MPAADYYGFVTRSENRSEATVYSWSVRQPLPVLPIPLRAPDPDLSVDLQPVFQMAFERGRYAKPLRKRHEPTAPLRDEDRAWAIQVRRGSS
ncbi:MAG: DUF4058 family protein [Gemmataceae bacterium]|nr:DUF4058 family protein [Gemmataceae bacterium]